MQMEVNEQSCLQLPQRRQGLFLNLYTHKYIYIYYILIAQCLLSDPDWISLAPFSFSLHTLDQPLHLDVLTHRCLLAHLGEGHAEGWRWQRRPACNPLSHPLQPALVCLGSLPQTCCMIMRALISLCLTPPSVPWRCQHVLAFPQSVDDLPCERIQPLAQKVKVTGLIFRLYEKAYVGVSET